MFEGKVIYERKYPHKTEEEKVKEAEEWVKEHPAEEPEAPPPSFSEFYRKMVEGRTLVLLPARIEGAERFIQLAIEAGELYNLDTEIVRMDSHISVSYGFDCCEGMDYLMQVVRQADAMSFFSGIDGYDITLILDYYTHAVYQNGRLLRPLT